MRIRTERGISQERLGLDAGVDRAYISQIERQVSSASLDFLDKVATYFKVPVAELFQEPEPGAKKPKAMVGGRPRVPRKRIPN
jgi:transcriptional regulator with XRE-family HTH domain